MLNYQILEYFKGSFPPKIESQLLETDDTDAAIVKEKFSYCHLNQNYWNLQAFWC